LAFYYEWKSPNDSALKEDEEVEGKEVYTEDINELEEKYKQKGSIHIGEDKSEIGFSDLEKHQTVKGYDYESFYIEEFGREVYKEVISFTEDVLKEVFSGAEVSAYKDHLNKEVIDLFLKEGYIPKNKMKSIDVFPIEPKYENDINLGISVDYSDNKSEFFNASFELKDDEYILYEITSEWSN